jgi:hypothetical protein
MWKHVQRFQYIPTDAGYVRLAPFDLIVPAGTTYAVVVAVPSWDLSSRVELPVKILGERATCGPMTLRLPQRVRKTPKTLSVSVKLDEDEQPRARRLFDLVSQLGRKRVKGESPPPARGGDLVARGSKRPILQLTSVHPVQPPPARSLPLAAPTSHPGTLGLSKCRCGGETIDAALCYRCDLAEVLARHDREKTARILERQKKVRRLETHLTQLRAAEEADLETRIDEAVLVHHPSVAPPSLVASLDPLLSIAVSELPPSARALLDETTDAETPSAATQGHH